MGQIGPSLIDINSDIENLINLQSSVILEKIIGVTTRTAISGQGGVPQMKHIRNRLKTFGGRRNPPWVYDVHGLDNHNISIQTIDNHDKSYPVSPTSLCYGTGENIHFGPLRGPNPHLRNEWEHWFQIYINY